MSRDDAMTPRTDADRIAYLERQVALLSAEVTRLLTVVGDMVQGFALNVQQSPQHADAWLRVLHGASGESLRAQAAIEEVVHGR